MSTSFPEVAAAAGMMPATHKLVNMYRESGHPWKAYTLPLYSTAALAIEVFAGPAGVAVGLIRAGAVMRFFNYGTSSQIPTGLVAPQPLTEVATAYHTNLSEPSKTPLNMDFAIEGLSCSALPPRIQFAEVPGGVDPSLFGGWRGGNVLVDLASVYTPALLHSPYNLEHAIDSAIRPHVSLTLEWGDSRSADPLGMLDNVPDDGARSYLKAAGEPRQDNQLFQPEGHLWMGQELGHDSKLSVKAIVERDVEFVLGTIQWPQGEAPTTPVRIVQDYRLRFHGLGAVRLGKNQ